MLIASNRHIILVSDLSPKPVKAVVLPKQVAPVSQVTTAKQAKFVLRPLLQKALEAKGYSPFTPIQELSFPSVLEGKEFYALSPTGTGKTAAFLVPVINKILAVKDFQVIVLEPSRELVIQAANECRKISEGLGVMTVACYGGTDPKRQEELIGKGANVIVATPERMRGIMTKGLVTRPNLLVLDEADRVLSHQFTSDVTFLGRALSSVRTVFFSVQMPKGLLEKGERIFKRKFEQLKTGTVAGDTITHSFVTAENTKEKLAELIKANPVVSIVFCKTADELHDLLGTLKYHGLRPLTLHADKGSKRRHNAVRRFKHGETLLLCTDLAARGVHFVGVKRVYSLGLPADPEFYVHRAGRTGRMNQAGESISVISEHEVKGIRNIYASLGITPISEEFYAKENKNKEGEAEA